MLETKLKKWNNKKVKASYIYKDKEGNVYNPFELMEELKNNITEQGFTFTEKDGFLEINETGQFFSLPTRKNLKGFFNSRSTKYEILDDNGKRLLSGNYPTKKDIVENKENYFIKKVYDNNEIKIELIEG
jgi:hypothetical protein